MRTAGTAKGAIVPTVPLQNDPNLENLKNQAKLVQQLVRDGDDGAVRMVHEFHPRLGDAAAGSPELLKFKRTDAQLVIARMYGFASWAAPRRRLALIEPLSRSPVSVSSDDPVDAEDLTEAFLLLACLDYGMDDPTDRIERAHRLLVAHPEVGVGSPYAMAAVGDHGGLAAALEENPALVSEIGGPQRWPLLLFVAYTRIATDRADWSTLETARMLLDRGADPNAGYLWRGQAPPFTALAGAFGRGEQDEPPHEHCFELARLLLEAGGDPNDGQALYNNGLAGSGHDNAEHLELLLEFGLGAGDGGPWYAQLGSQLDQPEKLLYDELEVAANGRPNRMRVLIAHGLDLNRPVGRSNLTPVRLAAQRGHQEILDLLAADGLDTTLTPAERFVGATLNGHDAKLRELIDSKPDIVATMISDRPDLVARAAERRQIALIQQLVHLGFDVNMRSGGSGTTALHKAAIHNDVELARVLTGLGADPTITDTYVSATPLGWAEHGHCEEVAAYLPFGDSYVTSKPGEHTPSHDRSADQWQRDAGFDNCDDVACGCTHSFAGVAAGISVQQQRDSGRDQQTENGDDC